MAVYHLACRLLADPTRTNPPARTAKWQQACALPSCHTMIWKGDTISCTRDNENGHRKGALPPIEAHRDEDPVTERRLSPFEEARSSEYVPRETLDCARRELELTRRALDDARAELADARAIIAAIASAIRGAE